MTMTLNPADLSRISSQLDKRYASLLDEVREELADSENQQYVELIGRMPADAGDRSVGIALADLNLTIIDRHVRELRDIEASRARIADTTFGCCADCGGDIAVDRLCAYPTAKRCFVCQRQREKTYVHDGTPTL